MQHVRKTAAAVVAVAAAATAVSLAVPAHAARHQPAAASTDTYVRALYTSYLDRDATDGEVTYWQGVAAKSGIPAVTTAIVLSAEADAVEVENGFAFLLDREPTQADVTARVAQIQQTNGLDRFAADLLSSPEFFASSVDFPANGSCGTQDNLLRSRLVGRAKHAGVAPHDVTTTATQTVTATATATATATETVTPTVTVTTTPPPSTESLTDRWLDDAYCFALDRAPDASGRAAWDQVLGADSTAATRDAVALAILRSPEALALDVRAAYLTALDRAPESDAVVKQGVAALQTTYAYGYLAYLAGVQGSPEGYELLGSD